MYSRSANIPPPAVPILDLKKVETYKDALLKDDTCKTAIKYKSRELMEKSGDKFNDLYNLSSQISYLLPKVDKDPNDIEFDKSKKECVFKPKICKRSMQLADTSRQRLASPACVGSTSGSASARGARRVLFTSRH